MTGPEPTFEESCVLLEEMAGKVEVARTSFKGVLSRSARGEALHALCRATLDAAEARVAELLERLGRAPDDGAKPG